jgi:4-amino-4-deoxy-L-arabinose transferase-like glycosyltransferase
MRFTRPQILLASIFLLAIFLRLFRLGLDGFSNLYYAATVQSVLTSPHNFFFVSFDPVGFVSVDKPPLGFWVQALSVSIFGFHGWALVLPQALAGALSTLVLYYLVKRVFGVNAGLLAALILAITPISVATARSNTPDSQLTLVLLLAALAAVKAAESGKLRWLVASAALVGVGFNVKMLQAYLVVPAFFFFLPPPHALLKRLGQLTLAMLVMFTVSFAWTMAVDLTPASERPYVGSTGTNHVIELIAVHNGVRRLGPIAAWFGIREKDSASTSAPQVAPVQPTVPAPQPDSAKRWPDGGLAEVGEPGMLRLFNPQLAGQVSWLLPLALLALVSGMARANWKLPLERETLFYLLWAGWLIPAVFFFSYGGLIHRYYLDMLAPPVAALSAVGLVTWMNDFLAHKRAGWLLPIAILLTTLLTIFFLGYYPEVGWLFIPVGIFGILTLLSFFFRLSSKILATLTIITILLIPFVWSTTPMWKGGDVILPYAGPDLIYWGGARDNLTNYESTAAFLQSQHKDETFLVATENAVTAAPLELLTKQPVMAMGGFTGGDPILTTDQLAQLVAARKVRFFLMEHHEPITYEKTKWMAQNCSLVKLDAPLENMDLYDCRP